jgi:hypothetical protein
MLIIGVIERSETVRRRACRVMNGPPTVERAMSWRR